VRAITAESADSRPTLLTGCPPGPTFGSAARTDDRRWATTGWTDSGSRDAPPQRPRSDLLLVALTSAVTMELLASLGIAFGTPSAQAGMLGMLTVSVPMVAASALVLHRHPNRPVPRRFYLGLFGCGAVTALVLLVGGALNAVAAGAVLGPVCGTVVLIALVAGRGHNSAGQSGRIR
jgi:peptidoglycan/LPS O-acetylase OafA/YrhL